MASYSSSGLLPETREQCGVAADPHEPDALLAAMLAELADPTPAEAGIRRASECSRASISAQYEAVYTQALRL